MAEMNGSQIAQYPDSKSTGAESAEVPGSGGNWYWQEDTIALLLVAITLLSGIGMLLLLAVPAIVAVLGFLNVNLPIVSQVVAWLGEDSKALYITIALIVIAFLAYLLLRSRVKHNPLLFADAGCPQCHEHELIRVRRRPLDRLLTYLGIPVRRYVCRYCSWDGLRLGGSSPNFTARKNPAISELVMTGDLAAPSKETLESEQV